MKAFAAFKSIHDGAALCPVSNHNTLPTLPTIFLPATMLLMTLTYLRRSIVQYGSLRGMEGAVDLLCKIVQCGYITDGDEERHVATKLHCRGQLLYDDV